MNHAQLTFSTSCDVFVEFQICVLQMFRNQSLTESRVVGQVPGFSSSTTKSAQAHLIDQTKKPNKLLLKWLVLMSEFVNIQSYISKIYIFK